MCASLLLGLLAQSAFSQSSQQWRNPLGLPYGDVTYEEWTGLVGVQKQNKKDAILRQLQQRADKDLWAGFIASEILFADTTDAAQKESIRLLTLSSKRGNPLAQSYLGMAMYRSGKIDEGIRLLDEAAASGHPRARSLRLMITQIDAGARNKLQEAKSDGDELAAFVLAMYARAKNIDGNGPSIEAYKLMLDAALMNGLISNDPIKRVTTKSTDAPHAIFYSAQLQYFSQKEHELTELRSTETTLKDLAARLSPRDRRNYIFIGEDVSIRANLLLTQIYEKGVLKDDDKFELHLIRTSEMGLALASTSLALQVYDPRGGRKPNIQRYIAAKELAALQGGAQESLYLAREYLSGDFVPIDHLKVISLLEPWAKDDSKTSKEVLSDIKVALNESLMLGTPEQKKIAVLALEKEWGDSGNPAAALLLAKQFALERNNPQSPALTRTWFQRSYDGFVKISIGGMAAAVATQAAGESMTRNDISGYDFWKRSALSLNPRLGSIFSSGDIFAKLSNGDDIDLDSSIPDLKKNSSQGDVLADITLGFFANSLSVENVQRLDLGNYEEHFDRAIKRDGKLATPPLIAYFLQTFGPTRQKELLSWLQKTKAFHGPEESALMHFLEFSNSSEGDTHTEELAQSLIDDAKNGSGFAAGFVAEKRSQRAKFFRDAALNDVELLVQSTSSKLPYPDAYALLADRLMKGNGVARDVESAKYLLKRGAEIGSKKSMLLIAKHLSNGSYGGTDYKEALQFAMLAKYYGEPESDKLIAEIEAMRSYKQPVPRPKETQRTQPQNIAQQSSSSSFFSGLGGFLSTLLEVGLIVGLVVLTGGVMAAAIGGGGGAMPPAVAYYSPSPAYYAPATQISRATPALPVASYQSLGLPNYSSGRAIYTSKPSPLLPLPSAVTSQITNVEIRERFNYDPSKKLRGAVGSDGSFIAKSLEGGSVHGSITQSPAGKTEIQVRPSYNWDPSNSYRGELEAGGVVQLKNSITGKSIKGTYEWSSLYGVK